MPAPTAPHGNPLSLLAGAGGRGALPAQRRPPADRPPPRSGPLPVAAVLLATGLLLAVAVTSARRGAPVVTGQRSAIEAQVAARSNEVDGLTAARQRLQVQLAQARGTAASVAARSRDAAAELRRLGPATGAVAVTGPGLVVRLDDPKGGRSQHRITDSDLAQVANELWATGAEAMAVNGVRLTTRSAIRSAGDAVLVNLRPLSPPYRVAAIGSRDALAAGFADSPVASRLRTAAGVYGSSVSVELADRLTLPAAVGLTVRRATAPPGGSGRTGGAQ